MQNSGILAAIALAGALLIAPSSNAGAVSVSPAGLSQIGVPSAIEFVQNQ